MSSQVLIQGEKNQPRVLPFGFRKKKRKKVKKGHLLVIGMNWSRKGTINPSFLAGGKKKRAPGPRTGPVARTGENVYGKEKTGGVSTERLRAC